MGSGRVGLCSEIMITMALLSSFHGIIISSTSLNESENQSCSTSSCGLIQEIRYPFRLETDPDHCGDKRYNLSCENSTTVLYLYSGRYYVHSINYNNFTIRLMDSNVQIISNCSTKIPLHSLSFFNFTTPGASFTTLKSSSFSSYASDHHQRYLYSLPLEVIVFLNCRNPVNSTDYIDSTRQGCNRGEGNSYVMVGVSDASQIREFCRIELIVMTSFWQMDESYYMSDNFPDPNSSISLREVHDALVYGFELTWVYHQNGSSGLGFLWQKLQRIPIIILKGCASLRAFILILLVPVAYLVYRQKKMKEESRARIQIFLEDYKALKPSRYSYRKLQIISSTS